MGCPTQCLAEFCLINILTKLGLTRRCSRRLAGLFPSVIMIKILPEIASRALIRMLPMLTRSGFPSLSHRFPLAPFASGG
jgi:hypothetical protein